MNDLRKKTSQALAAYAGKKLAVGVSGGRDSVCLLHAVITCGVVDRSNVLAVHVNHNLRKTAVRDEEFVREFCAKNGVRLCCRSVDVETDSVKNGTTIEQAARELRYGIFLDLVKSGAADIVLTAHHALDNAESVLMHLFRGSGLDGLRSMNAPYIVRPFLDVYPRELDEYARENGIEYVVDETNFDDGADRNFLRLNVIPLIEKRYRGAVRAINELSRECDGVCEYLDGALDKTVITRSFGAVCIGIAALDGALGARYVRLALREFTLVDITRDMIENVVKLAHARTGAVVELAHGVRAAREYGCAAIYIPRLGCDGEKELRFGANYIDGLAVDVAANVADVKSVRGGVVDMDKLDGAVLRFRRDGDMFEPFGGGRKKLKQYFIDNKIPKRLRDRIPLVCKGAEVLAVVGMQISNSVAVTDKTVRVATLKVR